MLEEFEVFSKTRAFSEIIENIKELGNIDLILRNYLFCWPTPKRKTNKFIG